MTERFADALVPILFRIILSEGLVLGTIAAGIFILKVVVHCRRKWATRHTKRDIAGIHLILYGKNAGKALKIKRSRAIRNYIVKLSAALGGEQRRALVQLYTQLGFYAKDLRRLRGVKLKGQMSALQRCRSLELPLPEHLWERFLTHRNTAMRWAAMEYFIRIKGNFAILPFMRFFSQRPSLPRGMRFHLLACIAQRDREVIAFLLRHTPDSPETEPLQEMLLHVLALYPVASAAPQLGQILRDARSVNLLSASVQALGALPLGNVSRYLSEFANHTFWKVRWLVAEALKTDQSTASLQILSELSTDVNYQVREATVKSILQLNEVGHDLWDAIRDDSSHPSHQLCQNFKPFFVPQTLGA